MGLQPWELACPAATKWGAWDPGRATRQSGYLDPSAGGIHIVHMHTFAFQTFILLSQRGEQDEATGVLCVHVSVLCGPQLNQYLRIVYMDVYA